MDNAIIKNVTCRRSTVSDYDAVLPLRKEFAHFDYLPGMFATLNQDPNYYAFVAELEGRVIGYLAYYAVDGIMSNGVFYGMAGRVLAEYRHMGVINKLSKYFQTYIACTGVTKTRIKSLQRCQGNMENDVRNNEAVCHYMFRFVQAYALEVSTLVYKLKNIEKSLDMSVALDLPLSDLIQVVTHASSMAKLMESSKLHVIIAGSAWLPYDLTKENLELITKKYNTIISLGSNVCSSLSTTEVVELLNGDRHVEFMYHGEPSVRMCVAHIVRHLHNILRDLNTMPGKILQLGIHTPENMHQRNLFEILKPVFGEFVIEDMCYKIIVLLDKYSEDISNMAKL